MQKISDMFDVTLAVIIYLGEIFLTLWRKMFLLWVFTDHDSNKIIIS